jgi:hypothetical protein
VFNPFTFVPHSLYREKSENNCERLQTQTTAQWTQQKQEIAQILLVPVRCVIFVEAGLNTTAGRTDIVVIAESSYYGNSQNREACIWEFKAPQLAAFRLEDSRNRAYPSKHLSLAENQLLHYHNELKGNRAWKEKWCIQNEDNVKLGGIIIGRDNNWVECNSSEKENAKSMAEVARRIRDHYFYRYNHIEFNSWDRIFEWYPYYADSFKLYRGESENIDISASQPQIEPLD